MIRRNGPDRIYTISRNSGSSVGFVIALWAGLPMRGLLNCSHPRTSDSTQSGGQEYSSADIVSLFSSTPTTSYKGVTMKILYALLLAVALVTPIAGAETETKTWGMVQFQPTILEWAESQVNSHNARLHKEGQPIEIVVSNRLPNTLQLTIYHKSSVNTVELDNAINETKNRADGEILAVVEMMINTKQEMPEGLQKWIQKLNKRVTKNVSLNTWLKDNRWYDFEEKRINIDALDKGNY